MKASATNQLAFDYDMGAAESEIEEVATRRQSMGTSRPVLRSTDIEPFKMPDFGANSEVYATTSRLAGRLNAASVSEAEHEGLLRERQALLDRLFSGIITKKEKNRLEYVRWSLDRIEDAKYGRELDLLESAVEQYERFLSDIEGLRGQLNNHAGMSHVKGNHRTRR